MSNKNKRKKNHSTSICASEIATEEKASKYFKADQESESGK